MNHRILVTAHVIYHRYGARSYLAALTTPSRCNEIFTRTSVSVPPKTHLLVPADVRSPTMDGWMMKRDSRATLRTARPFRYYWLPRSVCGEEIEGDDGAIVLYVRQNSR